jgi:repressor LexA
MGEALHPRRVEILRYLARRASVEGPPPSVREIGAAVGLSSSQTVHHHLGRLEGEGYVMRVGRGARTLGLTGKGWEAAGRMALLGRIAAGRGLEAVATDEAYSLAAELLAPRSGKRRYLLRVVGQSMVEARIEDGDLLVVEADESPPDGSIVVVLLREGEEVTVKRFYREGETLRLRPEAPPGEYEEMVVPAEEVRVQGRVVYVLHPPGGRPGGGIRV